MGNSLVKVFCTKYKTDFLNFRKSVYFIFNFFPCFLSPPLREVCSARRASSLASQNSTFPSWGLGMRKLRFLPPRLQDTKKKSLKTAIFESWRYCLAKERPPPARLQRACPLLCKDGAFSFCSKLSLCDAIILNIMFRGWS